MAKPLALAVSDLHFGEVGSVLHYGSVFSRGNQPLVNKLKDMIKKASGDGKIPYLILAGDTLDFSLASVQDVVKDFRAFLEDVDDCFGNIAYIPGNHDHHIWRTLQEEVFVINRIREREEIGDYPQEQIGTISKGKIILKGVTPKKALGDKTFLKNLLAKDSQIENFAVTYPNVFLEFDDPARNIIVTHGHFFELAWTLVSGIFKKSLNIATMDYRTLEMINSPVTEFGWYGLGQAGELSHFIEQLYKEIKNSEDRHLSLALNDLRDYFDELWTFNPAKKKGFFGRIKGLFSELKGTITEELSDRALDLTTGLLKNLIISQVGGREPQTAGSSLRHCPDILDDPAKRDRIKAYISYSLRRPYETKPGQMIFGHTHRPMKDGSIKITVDGRPHPIKAFNTGGWVVDSKDAKEIVQSRPLPMLIQDDGVIEPLDFPWPDDEKKLRNKTESEIRDIIQKGSF